MPVFTVLAACGSAPESATSKDPSDRTGTAAVKTTPDRPEAATCGATALGLCQAVAREPWNPPPGCIV